MFWRRRTPQCSMEQVVAYIDQADDLAISKIMDAMIRRYSRVFPDWDVIFYSLHKEPKQRAEDVKGLIRSLETFELKQALRD